MKQLVNDLTRGEVTFDLFYSNTQNLDQYITIKDMLFFFFHAGCNVLKFNILVRKKSQKS